ncbi:aldehyde dehydrogenase family protein [Dietzia sp. CH92]|uniref:aldehyde dehydrogenase family protein n=1 Tax=Dietzia sp. CH92 TaxID=3051823 RepID=UPI0028D67567|nr:aldehyde dehydrogenase family protein [Dietzia sp. CH92]
MPLTTTTASDLAEPRERQQDALRAAAPATADERRARIQAVIDLLVRHHDEFAAAIDADFGGRHPGYTLMNDVVGSLGALKHARDNLEQWMQPDERTPFAPYDQMGARCEVQYQPKGSVLILGTWNAPLFTLLSPLAGVLAAGNTAVIKPSEITSRTAELLARVAADALDPDVVAVVTGGADVAQDLTSQPFDHIVVTGSAAVGKAVMANAARNLVPVTLELGGKSPVIVGRSADLASTAMKIAVAKATNGGQICVSPDTVYVPRRNVDALVEAVADAFATLHPTAAANADVVSAVNDRHAERVDAYVRDAAERGARVVTAPAEEPAAEDRRRALRIVVDPPADAAIRAEEIFGAAMIVQPYDTVDEVVAEVAGGPTPLALYYFGDDDEERDHVLARTRSGGVTVNNVMMHPGMNDAPFGGLGASGMGHYNGREGFLQFSHARTVFFAPDADPRGEWGMLPPYGEHFTAAMKAQIAP